MQQGVIAIILLLCRSFGICHDTTTNHNPSDTVPDDGNEIFELSEHTAVMCSDLHIEPFIFILTNI